MNTLYMIRANYFVAGLEVNRSGYVCKCAPILYKWCDGRHISEVKKNCEKRKLKIEKIVESTINMTELFFTDE